VQPDPSVIPPKPKLNRAQRRAARAAARGKRRGDVVSVDGLGNTPSLLTTEQAAELLGAQPYTLERWRVQGFGPPYYKIGSLVRYQYGDLMSWVASRRVSSTTQETTA
jgi:hypothetical protein